MATVQDDAVCAYRHVIAYRDASDKLRLSLSDEFMRAVRVNVNATCYRAVFANGYFSVN